MREISRRTLLRGAGTSAAVLAVGGRLALSRAATDGQTPRLQWVPVSTAPIASIASSNVHEAELLHPTLLPLRWLTGSATAPEWVVWAWHHDTNNVNPHLHAWTASNVEGSFTAAPPIPRPAGDYQPNPVTGHSYSFGHFSSGDIVWDAEGGRLISTPHSVSTYRPSSLAETPQDSFMMESTDGFTWTWLDGDATARLMCGDSNALDSNHTGYGRLLRDLNGTLQRLGGQYWWIYRGGHHPKSSTLSLCTPLLASSSSIGGPWVKRGKAYDTAFVNTTLLGFDSFVLANETPGVFYSVGTPAFAPIVTSYTQSSAAGTVAFTNPGDPIPLPSVPRVSGTSVPGQVFAAGVNVVRDPRTHQQYLVQVVNNAKFNADTTSTPPGTTAQVTSSDIWIYKSVVA